MDQIFVNKAAASGIIAIDLLLYKPSIEVLELDIKDHLFMGMIVKEKEFKDSVSAVDFSMYQGKAVAVCCSVDAIIPPWVYMMLMEKLYPHAIYTDLNTSDIVTLDLWKQNLIRADMEPYTDQKVVVRAGTDIPPALYLLATQLLKPLVKSLMYGEIGLPKIIFKN